MAETGSFSAGILLSQFLELRALTPIFADWTEERLADNPPRLIRLRQLVSLFRVYGIRWDPLAFTRGEFIDPGTIRYARVLERLTTELTHPPEYPMSHQLPRFFEQLLTYRAEVERVLRHDDGVGMASGLYSLACRKAAELNAVISDHLMPIDDILAALINPEGIAVTRDCLIRDFGYPDVDLCSIDADWW